MKYLVSDLYINYNIIDIKAIWRHICDNIFYLCSAGIPSKFTFEMLNREEFSKEYPDFDDRFFNFSGSYTLFGFGKLDGCELKMGSTLDGLQGITPIWGKIFSLTDSLYLILYNQTSSKWELRETKTYNGRFSQITHGHIECKTG